eukprot:Nitzschia sp. Nitz4//scaffold212_size37733//32543//34308//NITZ4_007741-RA/size37733-augustus-gene-0.14-mRNA-1//-1//CDS//3329542046//7926//frame0
MSLKRGTPVVDASMNEDGMPRFKKTRRVDHASIVEDKTEFELEKLGAFQQCMEPLISVAKPAIIKAVDNDSRLLLMGEYRRVQREIKNRYNRTPGYFVAMGSDDCNQLGIATDPDQDKRDENPPQLVHSTAKFVQVAAGGLHSVGLTPKGEVHTWGVNDDNALGRKIESDDMAHFILPITSFPPIAQNKIIMVDAGDSHSLFLSIHHRVYMCGMYKDMDSGKFANLAPGQVLKSKETTQARPVEVPFPKPVAKIAAGVSFNAAILEDGSLYTWGMGHCGELARSRSMGAKLEASTDSGKMQYNVGKLFIGKEVEKQETNKKGEVETYTAFEYNFPLIADKFLKPAPVEWDTPGEYAVLDVSCGETHILAVARKGGDFLTTVYSSGHNQYGQLGHGDELQRHQMTRVEALDKRQIVQVAAGNMHSLALNSMRNVVYAWGRSDYGQLGLSDESTSSGSFENLPKIVPFPEEARDIGIAEISAGERTNAVIMEDGDVYTWGFNTTGATGHPVKEINGSEDILRPKKLNPMRYHKKHTPEKGTQANVHCVAGGGQHSLMVVERFE